MNVKSVQNVRTKLLRKFILSFYYYMRIFFLTTNKKKVREAQEILYDFEIIGRPIKLDEIQPINVDDVINYKISQAKQIFKGQKFIVEDTALYIGEEQEIGALIKFFKNDRIVKAYRGELAQAVCALGLSDGTIIKGTVKGTIVPPTGLQGFGWDPIFCPQGSNKTFAEMIPEEKNKHSMRRTALDNLRKYLLNH